MTASPARGRGRSKSRRIGFHVVAVLLGLASGLAGVFGLVSAFSEERLLHRMHDAAPSLVLVLVLAVGCAGLLGGRRRSIAAFQQVAVGVAGLTIGFLAAGQADGFMMVAVVVALVALIAALHPLRDKLLAVPRARRTLTAVVAVALAAPLLWYAFAQAGLQGRLDPANPHVAEGHYAGMAGTAIVFALLALLAAARTEGARLPTWSAGLGIAALGVLSVATPLLAGSFPPPWGLASVAGGAGLVLAGEVDARSAGRGQPAARTGGAGSSGTTDDTLDPVI